jgi:hypothetical protein
VCEGVKSLLNAKMTFQIYTKSIIPRPPSRQTLNGKRETETKTDTSGKMEPDRDQKMQLKPARQLKNCKD